jgi:uncharacterized membrane protein YccC
MSQSATTQSPGVRGSGTPAGPRTAPRPWWRVSWSVPAAMRAARATIVIPSLFAITYKVIADQQMTLFAVFGGFATLVVTSFAGTRRDKAMAHLGLALAGTAAVIIGTLVSGSAWLAAVATIPVAFAIFYGGSAGPNAAAGVTGCLFAYVLPVASVGSASVLPSRLEGWWLASAAGCLAVLLLSPRSPGDRLRVQAANLAGLLSTQLGAAVSGTAATESTGAVTAAKHELMNAWVATPYRPIGLAAADQGLASLIHLLEWCTSLVCDAADGHLDLPAAADADRELLEVSAATLRQISAVMSGQAANADLEPLWQARLASARQLHSVAADPEVAVQRADRAFHAQTIGVATSAAIGAALIAARLATPSEVATQRRNWVANLPESQASAAADWPAGRQSSWGGMPARTISTISADASLRSVWFRSAARGAIALAAAVAVAKITDVEHAFWVVLGTLSVLRTSASATGGTALRALAGTIAGFAVGAALLVGIGTNPAALWIAFPIAVLIAAYTPGTAPFSAGQAAFTVMIVVLFNLLVPAGWQVGLLRVEDVAIGCAVSLVVGFLFWPRGVLAVVGDNLADAFRSGAGYLADATSWALGGRPHRPERAEAAIAAASRLDDAVRGYLTEQGSKQLSQPDMWTLLMAAMRLRLTAHSMVSLPTRTEPNADDDGMHAALGRQAADLSRFYERIAGQVARPPRGSPSPEPVTPPAGGLATESLAPSGSPPAYRSDALWVGHHLDHLEAHLADVTGPAERLALLRRKPWWH